MSAKYKHPSDVPTEELCARLDELSIAVANKARRGDELTMRIPAECDRDADIVLAEAAKRLREREQNAGEAVYLIRVGEDRAWTECGLADYLAAKDRTYRVNGRLTPAESRIVYTHPAQAVSVPDVKAMAYRFMGWKFPKDIYPDGGLKLDRDYLDRYPELWPTGTNLLHLGQAEEMVSYMLASTLTAPAGEEEDHA